MKESSLLKDILLESSRLGNRLFRNNVAMAWVGKVVRPSKSMSIRLEVGDIVIRKARPLHAGLCEGSSDLIGWTTIQITPDMVGQKVAVFTGVEGKSDKGKASEEQLKFRSVVNKNGGIAVIAKTVEDYVRAISG